MSRKLRLVSSNESPAAFRKRMAEWRDQKAHDFDSMDLEVLELTQLLDLASEVHFHEAMEGHKYSAYGQTLQPLLRDVARRAKALGKRFDHAPEIDEDEFNLRSA